MIVNFYVDVKALRHIWSFTTNSAPLWMVLCIIRGTQYDNKIHFRRFTTDFAPYYTNWLSWLYFVRSSFSYIWVVPSSSLVMNKLLRFATQISTYNWVFNIVALYGVITITQNVAAKWMRILHFCLHFCSLWKTQCRFIQKQILNAYYL